jgi:hypothetical protein
LPNWRKLAADPALAFEVGATYAFAFAKGDTFSRTRWRFD